MVLRFFLFAVLFIFASCTQLERDNPEDINSNTYIKIESCPNVTVDNNTVTCGGQTYSTVNIGGKVWMAENLNYDVSGSVCYRNELDNCNVYGRLYNLAAAEVVCPSGWHLSNSSDWWQLVNYVESDNNCSSCAAIYLKAKGGIFSGTTNGKDSYGFRATFGGYGRSDGDFWGEEQWGYWWIDNEIDVNEPYAKYTYINMYAHYDDVKTGYDYTKYELLSVRCVKD